MFNVSDAVIEVTRRCNMECEHCLRGEPQNIDQTEENLTKFFRQIDYIGTLTLSGGEPSLVPHILKSIVKIAREQETHIGNFYVATNGKRISLDFINACVELYTYCEDNELSCVHLSQDDYHELVDDSSCGILSALSFFSKKDFTHNDFIIPQGRAEDFGRGRVVSKENFTIYDDASDCINIEEGIIYLNCKGDIIAGCDWSYENQEKYILAQAGHLTLDSFKNYMEEN